MHGTSSTRRRHGAAFNAPGSHNLGQMPPRPMGRWNPSQNGRKHGSTFNASNLPHRGPIPVPHSAPNRLSTKRATNTARALNQGRRTVPSQIKKAIQPVVNANAATMHRQSHTATNMQHKNGHLTAAALPRTIAKHQRETTTTHFKNGQTTAPHDNAAYTHRHSQTTTTTHHNDGRPTASAFLNANEHGDLNSSEEHTRTEVTTTTFADVPLSVDSVSGNAKSVLHRTAILDSGAGSFSWLNVLIVRFPRIICIWYFSGARHVYRWRPIWQWRDWWDSNDNDNAETWQARIWKT